MKSYFLFILFISGFLSSISAQQFPFQNFGVEKGLIQSQVTSITQDKQHHLWVGTFGGLDRFDGSSFRHFTKADGINSSSISCLTTARNGHVWIGTFKGISCYNGFSIVNYPVPATGSFYFTSIIEDAAGDIWVSNNNKELFVFRKDRFVPAELPLPGAIPTCLSTDQEGRMIANFYPGGLYVYHQHRWQQLNQPFSTAPKEIILFIRQHHDIYYALTSGKRLVKFSSDSLYASTEIKYGGYISFCIDRRGNAWVGTSKGVYVYRNTDLALLFTFNGNSGLSDNIISSIYRDTEDNIWIGTDGDGLFKYSDGVFARFDKFSGLPGNVVMGIAANRSSDLIYLGTREGGLVSYRLSNKKISPVDYSAYSKAGINCMASTADQQLFLGTMDGKLLHYKEGRFRELLLEKKNQPIINSIISEPGITWFTTSRGCYYYRNDSLHKVKGLEEITMGVHSIPGGITYTGSFDGLYVLDKQFEATKVNNPVLSHTEIHCLLSYGDFLLVGTADEGIFSLNLRNGKIYTCDSRNGLLDNNVYSIFTDSKGKTWVGTGTGIQQLQFDATTGSFEVKSFSRADGYENAENNLNAIAEDREGAIWIGTTRGAYRYQQQPVDRVAAQPFIVIQSVESPGLNEGKAAKHSFFPWYHLPESPVLSYQHNKISFTVKGIYLRDPASVLYSYQLEGYDKEFSSPVNQPFFNYQSLEPGHYTFRVKAISSDGTVSINTASYSFTIATPFYKSIWFLFLLTASLILTGILVQYFFSRAKSRKKLQLELLRYEEQQKIRQRTSEDFHDELGNKLTRISLLADILQKKVPPEDSEKQRLLQQIRDNVMVLYAGTKDIIWSLTPGSDHLSEILKRIQHFAEELFHDSSIDIFFSGIDETDPAILLPADYSRNIIMIFKELLNNSLRHSGCSTIVLSVVFTEQQEAEISIRDNGKGFNPDSMKRGNGLNNIQRRAARIKATVEIANFENEGTMITLRLKIPSKGG